MRAAVVILKLNVRPCYFSIDGLFMMDTTGNNGEAENCGGEDGKGFTHRIIISCWLFFQNPIQDGELIVWRLWWNL